MTVTLAQEIEVIPFKVKTIKQDVSGLGLSYNLHLSGKFCTCPHELLASVILRVLQCCRNLISAGEISLILVSFLRQCLTLYLQLA